MNTPHFLHSVALLITLILIISRIEASPRAAIEFPPPDSGRDVNHSLDSALVSFSTENYGRTVAILGFLLRHDSTNWRGLDLMGQSMGRLNLFRQSLLFFDKGMRAESSNAQIPMHAAQACIQAGFTLQARGYFETALLRKPDFVPATLEYSKLLAQEGDRDKAIEVLTAALHFDSTNLQVNYLLGSNLNALHKSSESIIAFNRALQVAPTFMPVLRELGLAYLAADSIGMATITFRQALDLLPSDQVVKMNLASCYFRRKEYARARQLYLQIDRANLRSNALVQAGMSYYFESHSDSALTLFQSANQLDSLTAAIHFDMGLCLTELKKYKEAVVQFEIAVVLSKDALIPNAYDRMGTAYSSSGNVRQAVKAYEHSLLEDSGNDRTYYNLGVLYETKGKNPGKAKEAYKHVVVLAKNTTDHSSVYWKAKERLTYLSHGIAIKKK